MVDVLTKEQRRLNMSRIRSKDTKPERVLRSLLHAKGLRFRLHAKHLPGKPDLVLPKYQAVVFVHGCFWHGHECHLGRLPKSGHDYWSPKIAATRGRDAQALGALAALKWRTILVWECALRGKTRLDTEAIFKIILRRLKSKNKAPLVIGAHRKA
jgi:DNA mismatch endonuclease, patch repair protein